MLYFKLPFYETLFTTDNNPNFSNVSFHQFNEEKKLDFKGNIVPVAQEDFIKTNIKNHSLSKYDSIEETEQEYIQKLQKVIDFIKENKLKKLVISRRKKVDYEAIDFQKTFQNLNKKYPNAFVYFFQNNGAIWMGAFSELLGKYNKKTTEFQTMSLAGTLPVEEEWSTKEIEEQQPVSDYIQEILQKYSDQVKASPTYDHISGNIKHLRTDFTTKINPTDLEQIISELHPTPAVCGIPKDFCKEAIHKFEQFPREFYAGFSRIETEKEIFYFVNLRCGKFYRNTAELFVGGGITKDSNPEKEWQETELKAEALLTNLAFF